MASLNLEGIKGTQLEWLKNDQIRPYVFVREDMRVQDPGSNFNLSWFPDMPLWFNPLQMDKVSYANQILNMERRAFHSVNMAMPRWVFYDCAIMPGFVAGFAHRTATLPLEMQVALGGKSQQEWTPISLFIIIPTMRDGEWFAHNLTSINSLLNSEDRWYALGFLTKCFGLWYANIKTCCGATQWTSPALRLHTQYGAFEVLTAFTPSHDYAHTITYRVKVDPHYWESYFLKKPIDNFEKLYESTGFIVEPKDEQSLIQLQRKIENHEGPFFLSPMEIRAKAKGESLSVYRPRVLKKI
ncbi:MAG: hypothetical protein H6625_03550 [Bdellovibrionaceae bacterium]|nr:hypothetical protein [Pseudobdellovibrionaceae bacterium]